MGVAALISAPPANGKRPRRGFGSSLFGVKPAWDQAWNYCNFRNYNNFTKVNSFCKARPGCVHLDRNRVQIDPRPFLLEASRAPNTPMALQAPNRKGDHHVTQALAD